MLARFRSAVLKWLRPTWPVPTVSLLFVLSLLLVAAVEWLPQGWSDVTMTVHARTEVLELDLQPGRRYVWWLPAGRYSLVAPESAAGCERPSPIDAVCTYPDRTAVTIEGGATARFEIAPGAEATPPRFSMALTPRVDPKTSGPSSFAISGAGTAVATHDLVTFEAEAGREWRIPVIAERVQLGESLAETIAADDALSAAHQPILTEGDARMFARSLGSEERYQIQSERFDPADVVQIPAEAAETGLLLGLLSLPAGAAGGFDVTLHTDLAEVFVRRLGAQHRIGVSTWSIVSNLPLWLALWVVWAAFVVVANYHAQRLQYLGSRKP